GALMYWEHASVHDLPPPWVSTFGDAARLAVLEIVVAVPRRREGIGRRLMAEAATVALHQGIPYLWAWPSPRGAEEQRRGRVDSFHACGLREFRPDEDHLEMVGAASDVITATS